MLILPFSSAHVVAAIWINPEKPQFIVLDEILKAWCRGARGTSELGAFWGSSDPAALSTSPWAACRKGLPAHFAAPELWEMLFSSGKGLCEIVGTEVCGAASRWCLDRCAQFVIQGCFLYRHTQQIQPQISASSSFLSVNPSFHPRFNPSFRCFTYNNTDSDVFIP